MRQFSTGWWTVEYSEKLIQILIVFISVSYLPNYFSIPPLRITGHPISYQRNSLIQYRKVSEILRTVAFEAWCSMCFATDNFSSLSKFPGCTHTNFCFSFLFCPTNTNKQLHRLTGVKWTDSGKGGLWFLFGTEAAEKYSSESHS